MKSSEFNKVKVNLYNYFNDPEKWEENEYGEYSFYKGKRNLKELKFVLKLVFGDEMEIISEEYFKTDVGTIVGGSISLQMYIDADFNGMNQGTKGADVFIKFTLTNNAYFHTQSDRLTGICA